MVTELGLSEDMGQPLTMVDEARLSGIRWGGHPSNRFKRELDEILLRKRKYKLDSLLQLPGGFRILGNYCVRAISEALTSRTDNSVGERMTIPDSPRRPSVETPAKREDWERCSTLLAQFKARYGIELVQELPNAPENQKLLQIWHTRQLWFDKGPDGQDLLMVCQTYFDLVTVRFARTIHQKAISQGEMSDILSPQGPDVSFLNSLLALRTHLSENGRRSLIDQVPDNVLSALKYLDDFLGGYGRFTEIAGPLMTAGNDIDFRSLAIRFQFFRTVTSPTFIDGDVHCDYCSQVWRAIDRGVLRLHILKKHIEEFGN
ncbi:hypothetical protein FS749_005196 [Ceratobasidium sp. UAMH 11750]|nr:hypothetical protein FS749_005196 [Ceratobasidium sp. UAMH 11750]